MKPVKVIGGGLAGCEAAWQLARRGVAVELYEMRPGRMTAAHKTAGLAELVCSNSLRAASLENAVGLLKEEMRRCGSLIIEAADATAVPAGGALAVDRQRFSALVEEKLCRCSEVTIHRQEVTSLPLEGVAIIATGPLTDGALADAIADLYADDLYFYDAVAPIISGDSIDRSIAFAASRYDKGAADYLNCPLNEVEYTSFYEALIGAALYEPHTFEKIKYFAGCMPIEAMAARGKETMAHGPLKPVGLKDPRTGERPYAVVQLRKEDIDGQRYNMVGFQTHLRRGEQERVFRMIPGLASAVFERYGMIHRNTYILSPRLLLPTLALREVPATFFAGQITGVEGYVESAAMGLLAGLNAARTVQSRIPVVMPVETAIGALANHVAHGDSRHFEPMNVSYGLFPPLQQRVRGKREKHAAYAKRSLAALAALDLS